MDKKLFNKLIKEIREENHHAFDLLFKEYEVKLKQVAYMILKDDHLAEDVFSDVMGKLWRGKVKKNVKNPNAFMYQMTKNVAKDYLTEKRKRESEVSLDEIDIEVAATNNDFEKIELIMLLEKFGEIERDIVTKKVVMQDTFKDISKDLNIPVTTVKRKYSNVMQEFAGDMTGGLYVE